ncbi:MAG: hypothetical protein A2583_06435 [Bdellovibrionales bacterium RIFOXYD1_FULL_53_11]|nr:MAG: hypothetical protein A2583_06435 [Bdellovibrionales bacterium RIFOXYD1_FULL_53_11]
MRVKKLSLRDFRNIKSCSLFPSERVNFLVGKNGQGKTSFLEALSFIASLRSFRGARTEDVVRSGEKKAGLSCIAQQGGLDRVEATLGVDFTVLESKTVKTAMINGKTYTSTSRYLSQRFGTVRIGFHAISFNPSDHEIIHGEPAVRRNYLNRAISAEDMEYFSELRKYHRILEQRNALLKESPFSPRGLMEEFTVPLVKSGAAITRKRIEWIGRLQKIIQKTASEITPDQKKTEAKYLRADRHKKTIISSTNGGFSTDHFAGQEQVPSLEQIEQALFEKLLVLKEAELCAGSTLVGPHRDDFMLFFGGAPLKGRGSQGETRSALLALKLSEIRLFKESTGHEPVLLLDDFSSELDGERRALLMSHIEKSGLQVFVTGTEEFPCEGKIFDVDQGDVKEREKKSV